MIYVENVIICIAAPIIMALFFVEKKYRVIMAFFLSGMCSCWISAYINSFFTQFYGITAAEATLQITPLVEELVIIAPVVFYILIFQPSKEYTRLSVIMTTVGFATFENTCYIAGNGTADIYRLVCRGFGTGAMHIVCGSLISMGILYMWKSSLFRIAGTMGLLSFAITYHALYNLLIYAGDEIQIIGYILPMITLLVMLLARQYTRRVLQGEALKHRRQK